MTGFDYSTVTELSGDEISQEQLERLCHRYYWAATFSSGKDVIEAACGTGPGLGYLASNSKSVRAGDFSNEILKIAQSYYDGRIGLLQFDAQRMPYPDNSADVIILFEAIYYLPDASKFVLECKRVLRSGGDVLIATANKDLYDFNPSPRAHKYYGAAELQALFTEHGFTTECLGYLSTRDISLRQRILRPIKRVAVMWNLMPKTAHSKKWLKRLVFGEMTRMPAEIREGMIRYTAPTRLGPGPDREHKVIYCAARLPG